MLRHSLLTTQIRFFIEDSEDPFAPYDAICTLCWESASTVMLVGMHGTLNRKLFRELISFLAQEEVRTLKAYRSPTHTLPFATQIAPDLYQIDIAQVQSQIN